MTEPTASTSAAPRLTALALKQPALALTALYLITAVIGMTIAYFRYAAYGLLIFAWWEPSDYFLAAFREPSAFALAAWVAALGVFLAWIDRMTVVRSSAQPAGAAPPRARRWWNRSAFAGRVNDMSPQGRMWLVVAYSIFVFFIGAASGAFVLFEDVAPEVRIRFADGSTLPAATSDGCYLLGTSNRFLFVGTTARRGVHGGKVSVLPLDNIVAIERLASD